MLWGLGHERLWEVIILSTRAGNSAQLIVSKQTKTGPSVLQSQGIEFYQTPK